MIQEDLVAERVVIQWYAEIARWFGDADPTTKRLMEDLLAKEEEHADDLADLLVDLDVNPSTQPTCSANRRAPTPI
jgi:bacterioferritin (cytochrome b1)